MKKHLITGGAGFIGSHIADMLCQKGDEVIIFDNLATGSLDNVGHAPQFIKGNIFNKGLLQEVIQGLDTVYHLASLSWEPQSFRKTLEHMAINSIGTVSVLDAAKKNGNCEVICTCSEISNRSEKFFTENGLETPETGEFYKGAKLDAEYYAKMYRDHFGLFTYFMNYRNVFGPRQDASSSHATIIPTFIKKALCNQPLIIYGDEERIHHFTYVKDVASAYTIVPILGWSAYDIECTRKSSLLELAHKIIDLCGSKSEIQFAAETPGNIMDIPSPCEESMPVDFSHLYSMDEALKETITYYESAFRALPQLCY